MGTEHLSTMCAGTAAELDREPQNSRGFHGQGRLRFGSRPGHYLLVGRTGFWLTVGPYLLMAGHIAVGLPATRLPKRR